MKKMLLFTSLITVCTAMTCDNDDVYYLKFNQAEFDQQRTLWENQNIKNYSYKLSYFSSATGPQTSIVEVKNGVFVSSDDESSYPYSINDIFKRIESDIEEAKKQNRNEVYGATMDITYNKEYHYPEKIHYSVSYKTDIVGGAYYDLSITEFQVK